MLIAFQVVLVAGGIPAAVYGVWQVYPPAAWIIGGVAAAWVGLEKLDDGHKPEPRRPGGRR